MKAGDEINCPHCGRNSFLKKLPQIDGWIKKSEILACAACSAKIADISSDENSQIQNKALSKLASFLNEEKMEKNKIEADENEKKFCKDCANFIKHPFNDKCGLHDKFVNPMNDCNDFRKKSK